MSTIQTERPDQAEESVARLTSLEIVNFRAFDRLKLNNLGRVNLLVGLNNCGKTTVLEAVNILMLGIGVGIETIWSTLANRGENLERRPTALNPRGGEEVDIRRLFHGHVIPLGASFSISAGTSSGGERMTASVGTRQRQLRLPMSPHPPSEESESAEDLPSGLSLSLTWSRGMAEEPSLEEIIEINRRGGFSFDSIRRRRPVPRSEQLPIVKFVTAASLATVEAAMIFDQIVLTPKEELVVEALKFIEPGIERIASTSNGQGSPRRGGMVVRVKDSIDRIPIGSMGDGIWRMLGLALAVVNSENGILLIDEIDTGLHHLAMKNMWRFLSEASKKYNVQVIATSHSRDCYQSLAAICREDVSDGSEVTISRIERGRDEAVQYSEEEIIAAAEHDIEVR